MKLLTHINQHWKNILIVALLILLFIAFKNCKGATDKHKALASAAKSLEAKVKADSIARNEERKAFQAEKKETDGKRQLAEVEKSEADKKVQTQQKTIDRLASVIRNTTGKPVDSSFVLVSPDFKKACDSFPNEVAALNLALADKDSSINGIIDLYNYEIQIRDEELFKEMNYSDSLKADFVRQTQLLKSALKQGKPKGVFLTGIGIMGNQEQFLGGASAKFAYLTKKQKLYMYSPHVLKLPGMLTAKLYHEATVMFNPFK